MCLSLAQNILYKPLFDDLQFIFVFVAKIETVDFDHI